MTYLYGESWEYGEETNTETSDDKQRNRAVGVRAATQAEQWSGETKQKSKIENKESLKMTADFKKKKGAISAVEAEPTEPQYKVYKERLVLISKGVSCSLILSEKLISHTILGHEQSCKWKLG